MGVTILDLNVAGNIIYGKVISYVGTTLSVFISQVLGTGVASTNWLINVGAPVGLYTDTLIHAQSTSGPYDIVASLGTAKTFNVLAEAKTFQGVAFAVGMRIRATRNGTSNWMEGICTSFTVTSMVIQIDRISGTGNFAGWELTIADGTALEGWRRVGADGGNTAFINGWTSVTGLFYRKDYNTGVVYVICNDLDGTSSTGAAVGSFVDTAYVTAANQIDICHGASGARYEIRYPLSISTITDFDPYTTVSGYNGILSLNFSYIVQY